MQTLCKFHANKWKSHLWQNINSLDCQPTIKVLWADCIVVTCCLWGGDVIPLACVDTISQSELAIVPLWPMGGPWLCHIVVTSVTLLTQSAICSLTLMDSAASQFYTNGHWGPGAHNCPVQWPGHLCSWAPEINQREETLPWSGVSCFVLLNLMFDDKRKTVNGVLLQWSQDYKLLSSGNNCQFIGPSWIWLEIALHGLIYKCYHTYTVTVCSEV